MMKKPFEKSIYCSYLGTTHEKSLAKGRLSFLKDHDVILRYFNQKYSDSMILKLQSGELEHYSPEIKKFIEEENVDFFYANAFKSLSGLYWYDWFRRNTFILIKCNTSQQLARVIDVCSDKVMIKKKLKDYFNHSEEHFVYYSASSDIVYSTKDAIVTMQNAVENNYKWLAFDYEYFQYLLEKFHKKGIKNEFEDVICFIRSQATIHNIYDLIEKGYIYVENEIEHLKDHPAIIVHLIQICEDKSLKSLCEDCSVNEHSGGFDWFKEPCPSLWYEVLTNQNPKAYYTKHPELIYTIKNKKNEKSRISEKISENGEGRDGIAIRTRPVFYCSSNNEQQNTTIKAEKRVAWVKNK